MRPGLYPAKHFMQPFTKTWTGVPFTKELKPTGPLLQVIFTSLQFTVHAHRVCLYKAAFQVIVWNPNFDCQEWRRGLEKSKWRHSWVLREHNKWAFKSIWKKVIVLRCFETALFLYAQLTITPRTLRASFTSYDTSRFTTTESEET